ncbi:hypothetical protein Tco_0023873, partial [Tanacetum coccineum]
PPKVFKMASQSSLALSYLLNLNSCSSKRANNKVVLTLTSFLLFCMSLVVIATVIPFFFADASLATTFPGSSGGTFSGKSSTVAKLLSSVNISSGKIYTNSGKSTLAVGMNMTNSGNALEHFIPNNPPLNLILHLQIKFLE